MDRLVNDEAAEYFRGASDLRSANGATQRAGMRTMIQLTEAHSVTIQARAREDLRALGIVIGEPVVFSPAIDAALVALALDEEEALPYAGNE